MALVPITTSELRARVTRRGQELTVADRDGNVVVQGKLGKAAKPALAQIVTAEGRWRLERRERPRNAMGARIFWRRLPTFQERVVINTSNEEEVATLRGTNLTLADGETLTWAGPRIWTSLCGLGDGLYVAKSLWPRRRGFRAELSPAMLAREDKALLTGLGAILTQMARMNRRAGVADGAGLIGGDGGGF